MPLSRWQWKTDSSEITSVDNLENTKNDEKTSKQQQLTNTPRGANRRRTRRREDGKGKKWRRIRWRSQSHSASVSLSIATHRRTVHLHGLELTTGFVGTHVSFPSPPVVLPSSSCQITLLTNKGSRPRLLHSSVQSNQQPFCCDVDAPLLHGQPACQLIT